MTLSTTPQSKTTARTAGVLYLIIIVLGIASEVAIRAPLLVAGDAAASAANVRGAEALFRLSLAADTVMACADAALAVLLFLLLRSVNGTVALLAMVFRLLQAAIIGANLLNQQAVLLVLGSGAGLGEADALATLFLTLHGYGYDLGLIFFGVNSLLTGYLLVRSGWLPRIVGWGIVAAGLVYLTGSYLRILAPEAYDAFAVAYFISLVAELAFALWLLVRGLGPRE